MSSEYTFKISEYTKIIKSYISLFADHLERDVRLKQLKTVNSTVGQSDLSCYQHWYILLTYIEKSNLVDVLKTPGMMTLLNEDLLQFEEKLHTMADKSKRNASLEVPLARLTDTHNLIISSLYENLFNKNVMQDDMSEVLDESMQDLMDTVLFFKEQESYNVENGCILNRSYNDQVFKCLCELNYVKVQTDAEMKTTKEEDIGEEL